jgi:zinc transport system ATP-binding protein
MKRPAPLELDGVSFAYGAETVLDDVSLTVHDGEFAALVGPNGSGKSTLLRIAVGLLRPAAGVARLFGEPPERLGDRHRLGFVPQRPALAAGVAATVDDIAWSGRLTHRRWFGPRRRADAAVVERALTDVGLVELRHRRIGELSGGQQQRAFIARALAGEPDLLVLDEPVAGVDVDSQRQFRDSLLGLVRDRGGSVLLVSHELGAVADVLDRVVVLKGSVRFDGPPDQLTAQGVSLGVHAHDLPSWLEDVR